jgi:enoyl-[acyl-carrier protein] reductase II
METKSLTSLLGIKYPIIQAGMVWCAGWRLASAAANSGILGVIGAGSMHPDVLEEHIVKCRTATSLPFAVNVPMLYPELDKLFEVIIKNKVKIVITSAGNPATYTSYLKSNGIIVGHVVASTKFAQKAQNAGVDFIIAEGVEAGGHNGKEENTTFTLIPAVKEVIQLPLVAAGGIYDGKSILAAFVLGADGVQIGSRFAVSIESSANIAYKQAVINSKEGDTEIILRKLNPVRVLKNDFFEEIKNLENHAASIEVLKEKLGKGRAKKGIFEGDLVNGELEIGMVAARISKIQSVSEIVQELVEDYNKQISILRRPWN